MRDGCLVADGYVHIFPRETLRGGRVLHHPAGRLVEQMDLHGVDLSLVIARPEGVGVFDDVVRAHDDVAEATTAHPDWLAGAAWVAPRHGERGREELARRLASGAFEAVVLHPEQEQFNLDDTELDAAIAIAQAHGAPVVAHTSLATRGAEPWRLVRLARRFPSVSFVLSHLGGDGGMLQSLEAAKIAGRAPNILVDGSETVTDPFATYLGPALLLGPERVVFASGEPVHQLALGLLKMDLLEFEDDWRRLILGGNLLRILGRGDAPTAGPATLATATGE